MITDFTLNNNFSYGNIVTYNELKISRKWQVQFFKNYFEKNVNIVIIYLPEIGLI